MRRVLRNARLLTAIVFTALHVFTAFHVTLQAQASQNTVIIDASNESAPPQPVAAKLGSSRNPSGETIGVNSEYLTYDGKPWLPVMGEFHFSRYPEAQWEQEILKMKSAGVQIISSYVIWLHHEEKEGVFDWNGQRNLRRFVELCAKHEMYVYPRIGPWAHAEVRNGGLPDWVLKNSPVRQHDPVYLNEVQTFYRQIALQLKGLLWKDGGPVIGLQIENEYRERGPGKGDEHIRTLKKMAIADGLDVPLYTVTGWDGAAIPLDAVLPVFGGYPDAPWDGSSKKLPPNEVYAFRFSNRSAGSMGAIGGHGQSAASTYAGTPFLTAEVGDGIEDTYFRRPVVSADDVAAIAPVMLGSGVNLLGYYLFHGGRNPDGGAITLQESQATGYPTDVPVRSYDFQAPLGEFGQERESLRKLKLVHYFLADFGSSLAPMAPHTPASVPINPGDTLTPRVSARVRGESGFIFFNNYVRGLDMPSRPGFQVRLRLPSQTVRVPEKPIDLPSGAYGIWPVNLPLPGAILRYSTAQLFKRVQVADQTYFFFFGIKGVQPEFALDSQTAVLAHKGPLEIQNEGNYRRLLMNAAATTDVQLSQGVHLVLVPESVAEQIWIVDDPSLLLATPAEAFADRTTWTMQLDGQNQIDFGIFGSHEQPVSPTTSIHRLANRDEAQESLFDWYRADLPAVRLTPVVTAVRSATPRAPWKLGAAFGWRPTPIPVAPDDSDFAHAAVWNIQVPPLPTAPSISEVLLRLDYQGDVARLYHGGSLLDDDFWNGTQWTVGLRELDPSPHKQTSFELRILPLPSSFPMYLEEAGKLHFDKAGQAESLINIQMIPQYQLTLQALGHSR
jgi:beta-galactosidase